MLFLLDFGFASILVSRGQGGARLAGLGLGVAVGAAAEVRLGGGLRGDAGHTEPVTLFEIGCGSAAWLGSAVS